MGSSSIQSPQVEPVPPDTSCRRQAVVRLLIAAWLAFCGSLPAQSATIGYSTYFGGTHYDGVYAVAVDTSGNVFVAGGTQSTNSFPTLNAFQPDFSGGETDVFLAKFDPNGRLLFSTYFGGTGYEFPNAIALDRQGNVVIGGETRSVDLPTTEDAFQYDYGGGSAFGYGDGFIAKFSPDGAQLLYCSYFGGSGDDKINGLAIDMAGNVCVTGWTDSRKLPLRNPLQPKFGGGNDDGFVAKFDPSLRSLVFSTFFGGENLEEEQKIAVDPAGFIYICGHTVSTNFPVTRGAFQTNHVVNPNLGDNSDAFVAKLAPDGSVLIYSTYVGYDRGDAAFALAVDQNGSVYVTGEIATVFSDPGFRLGFQPKSGLGSSDAWLGKLLPDGSNFEWFSYLGGSGPEYGLGLALDNDNTVYVTGITRSRDFPTVDAVQSQFEGGVQKAFAAKISSDGNRLIYSTYLGGSATEWGYAVATDRAGNLLVVGQSASTNFPVLAAFQPTNHSVLEAPFDGFVVKLTPAVATPSLRVLRSGSNVSLAWPTNLAGLCLQSAVALSLNTGWSEVATTPLVQGEEYALVQPTDAAARFFRLGRRTTQLEPWETVDRFQRVTGMSGSAGDIGTDPTRSILYTAGSADANGVHVAVLRTSEDGGQTWRLLDEFAPPNWPYAHFRAFGSAPSGGLFTAGEVWDPVSGTKNWVVRRSTDQGATWRTVDMFDEGTVSKPSCGDIKVTASGEIYAAGVAGSNSPTWVVRKSADNGATWATVDSFLPDGVCQARAIGIHSSGSVFACGTVGGSFFASVGVWTIRRTQDGGVTWSTVDSLESEDASDAYAIAVDGSGAIYVSGAGRQFGVEYWMVRRSVDGGATWATVDKFNLPDNAGVIGTAIAFTSSTIYVCGVGGATNRWLVRKGTPAASGSITWITSDDFQMVPGQNARPNGIVCDRAGNVYVSGRATDETGKSHIITRRLRP
jgi:hypothetical protein